MSKTTPVDLGAEIWIRVQCFRIRERMLTGRTPSVAKACAALMAGVGIQSGVGGNPEALGLANQTRKKRWRRSRWDQDTQKLVSDPKGWIFISHHIESGGSLQARFSEANKLVKSNRLVRLVWMNQARQRFNRPVKKPKWGNPWHQTTWRFEPDGTLA
jgi:hypothetical protein